MAHGDLKKRATPNAQGMFIVYKIQPGDTSLKQIAREQLLNESLADKIVLDRETPNPNTKNLWDPIPAGAWDSRWTLLLPPSEFAAFVLKVKANLCKAPNFENTSILTLVNPPEKFFYKRSTVIRSQDGNVVWADVTRTNPSRFGNAPYWICVKNGIFHTDPHVEFPS